MTSRKETVADESILSPLTITTTQSSGYVESCGSSPASSSTLVDDSSTCSGQNRSQVPLLPKQQGLSTVLDRRIVRRNYIALRPWRPDTHQPALESLHRKPDEKTTRSRKGHRKSRQGCFECKKRKIKCQENLPACINCTRKGLVCKYPPVKPPLQPPIDSADLGSSLVSVQLQTTPIFTLADMRLFHYFISNAYPHLPVGNDAVWVSRVPAIAYQYEYLMHAMLALAASRLSFSSDVDYSSLALSHRLLAIKGLNVELSKRIRTSSDGDALLAACYALTFQSSYMEDGIFEFLTMVRGCGLVSLQLRRDNVDVSFSVRQEDHLEFMQSRLNDIPVIDDDLLQGSISSFDKLLSLCSGLEAHMSLYSAMRDCLDAIIIDSRKGYYKFIGIYQVFFEMDSQQFQSFNDPSSDVSRILFAHFMTLHTILGPILKREWQGRMVSVGIKVMLGWQDKLYGEIPPKMRHFLDWPSTVTSRLWSEIYGDQPRRPWLEMAYFKPRLNRLAE